MSKYHTQWAGQFYVAAELTRRKYSVTFTLGNVPHTDLCVISPNNKMFRVEVKAQSTKSFWIVRRHDEEEDHFYVFVYLPKTGGPQFCVLSCEQTLRLR